MKERTIFKSYNFLTLEEEKSWRQDILEWVNEDLDEDEEPYTEDDYEITDQLYEQINNNYDDQKLNINVTLPNNIIAYGTVGRWNGTFDGGKIMGKNLNEILFTGDCPDIAVTYDRYNVHSSLAHHDGCHHMTYRMVKEGVDPEFLLEKQVYGGGLTKRDLTRYTTSLVPYVKKIYG